MKYLHFDHMQQTPRECIS